MDFGAQRCAQRCVLHIDARRIRALCATAIGRALHNDVDLVCVRADVQADARDIALGAFGSGLLAARQRMGDGNQW